MTPKERAIELYFDFSENLWYSTEEDKHLNAKQCALISVDEIWNALEDARVFEEYDYWQEVKKEIDEL
jgi:hypothetical protein